MTAVGRGATYALDSCAGAAQTAAMARYNVTVTVQLVRPTAVDVARVRAATGATVTVLAPDILRVVMVRAARHARCAAERTVLDLQSAVGTPGGFARPVVWSARRAGLGGIRRATTGRWSIGGGNDDGSAGVREPRRPIPPHGTAAAALELPAT